ncbi:MAG TPA: hypothetical protein VNV66_11860, partial [Pilimelia sp.]|nr:hypothetical protein [Pilimelia sp.]
VEGRVLHALGELDLARGRTDLAVQRLTRAAEIFAEVSAVRWRASALSLLANASPGADGRAGSAPRSGHAGGRAPRPVVELRPAG